MGSQVPPLSAVRDDYRRNRGIRPPRAPFGITPGGAPPPMVTGAVEAYQRQAEEAERDWERRRAKPPEETPQPQPLVSHEQKRAERAATEKAASEAARARAPEAQPDNTPVTEPTSTGSGGPVRLVTESGWMEAKAPLRPISGRREPGKAEGYTDAPLPTESRVTYGPKSPTGGHSWMRMTANPQRAAYERARYGREVEARQTQEDAAIEALNAQAAEALAATRRAEELQEQPFAPEMAEVAGRVGEQRAKTEPELAAQSGAAALLQSYQEAKARIMADPNLSDEEKRLRLQDFKDEYYMALAGLLGRNVKPRDDYFSALALNPEETD